MLPRTGSIMPTNAILFVTTKPRKSKTILFTDGFYNLGNIKDWGDKILIKTILGTYTVSLGKSTKRKIINEFKFHVSMGGAVPSMAVKIDLLEYVGDSYEVGDVLLSTDGKRMLEYTTSTFKMSDGNVPNIKITPSVVLVGGSTYRNPVIYLGAYDCNNADRVISIDGDLYHVQPGLNYSINQVRKDMMAMKVMGVNPHYPVHVLPAGESGRMSDMVHGDLFYHVNTHRLLVLNSVVGTGSFNRVGNMEANANGRGEIYHALK